MFLLRSPGVGDQGSRHPNYYHCQINALCTLNKAICTVYLPQLPKLSDVTSEPAIIVRIWTAEKPATHLALAMR